MTPAAPPEARRDTMLRALLAVLTLHSLAFVYAEYSGPGGSTPGWRATFTAFAFLPLHIGSTVALWYASRRAALPAASRTGLRWLSASFGALVVGSIIWFAMYLIGRPLAYISWADIIYFQSYPLMVLGLWALPQVAPPRDRARETLDWIVVTLAFGSLIYVAAMLQAQSGGITTLQRVMTGASSTAQLISLIAVNRAIERVRRLPSAVPVITILAALAASTVTDLVFQILYSSGYPGPNLGRVVAILTNLAMVSAAIGFRERPIPSDPSVTAPRIPFSPLPIIAVSALALVLVWLVSRGLVTGSGTLLLGLVTLNMLLLARDVVASRAASRAIQASTEREATQRLEALVRLASDSILLLDSEGRLLFASAPSDRLFNAPLAALDGRTMERYVPETERGAWREFLEQLRREPGRTLTHSWRARREDGSERLIEAVGIDLRHEPAIRGIVVNARDITERESLEERLRQAQKLEVVGRLAGGVAHDFNNVLTAIIAGSELAQMTLGPGSPAHEELSAITGAAQRGAALTRRLLAFVRQEPVRPQSVPLDEMLHELAPLLTRMAGESHAVTVEVGREVGHVRTDRAELEHILFNLVSNARDSMPDGGPVRVTALVESVQGPLPHAIIPPPPGALVRLSVTDRGHGMSAEVRERMFDPFFTQKAGARGTGLGLIGVRPLIQGANGGLVVETSPAGTTVSLYLPIDANAPRRRTPLPLRPALRVTPQRQQHAVTPGRGPVLLIEDEPEVREQLARLLETRGYEVIPVTSASEARAALSVQGGIIAVISDVMMPGETGLEFAAWLRREHAALPVLLISGHTGAELDREARSTQHFPILRKPFSGAELAERLEAMLAASRGN